MQNSKIILNEEVDAVLIEQKYSFRNGYMQLRQMDLQLFKEKIMEAIGIKSEASWWRRLDGKIVPDVEEYEAIEGVFAQFGIKKNIWGRPENVTE